MGSCLRAPLENSNPNGLIATHAHGSCAIATQIMSFVSGILAALAGPLVMTIGFIVWDNHWTGSPFSLNLYKCNLASIGFVVLSYATRPEDPFSILTEEWQSVGFLMLSSTIGILIGDLTWLEGLRLLGARRVIVLDSLKPFLAAVFGWAFLGEKLRPGALGGIALTVVGILLVSLEETQQKPSEEETEAKEKIISKDSKERASTGKEPRSISKAEHVEASTRTEATAFGDPSTLSLATGSFPDLSESMLPVVMDKTKDVPSILDAQDNKEGSIFEETKSPPTSPVDKASEPQHPSTNADKRAQTRLQLLCGHALSIVNVVLDTYGSVLTKQHGANFTTWEINLVRFGFAGVVMGVCSIVLVARDCVLAKGVGKPLDQASDTHRDEEEAAEQTIIHNQTTTTQPKWYQLPSMSKWAYAQVSLGVLLVTFFTPALSNYALFQIALALALTLGSVGPIYALPLTHLMQRNEHKERLSLRACAGALLAVAGIVVLAFWGMSE